MSESREVTLRDEKETVRLEAFSDGVFAIAITLLVLDIRVPHAGSLAPGTSLAEALLHLWPAYLAYILSFLTILIMWASHHRLFSYIRRSDDRFLFLNGVLLLFVTFVPFPTALLSEYIRSKEAHVAAAVYSGTYLAVAVIFTLLWRYASRQHRLLDRNADPCSVEAISRQYTFGPPLYLAAFLLSFIWVPASVGMCFLLAIAFAATGKITRLTCHIHKR